MTIRNAPPHATAMVESIRDMGYSPVTAIADLVDNSISANAQRIFVHIHWDGAKSWVRILDDGHGMDEHTLENAMRLGAKDPRERRQSTDLGRFGLGLKTASFSQARKLTVASRMNGNHQTCLRWDIERFGQEEEIEWPLYEGPDEGSEVLIQPLDKLAQGTVVLWECLDRMIPSEFEKREMIDLLENLERHLAMTFHRYIDDSGPALQIFLNDHPVAGWDPFMLGHPSKPWESPEYKLMSDSVVAQCHVLPHADMMSKSERADSAGHNGWINHQGFYVYRNKRLLQGGGWLGLSDAGSVWQQDEAHRLARIRLDIPNCYDVDWKIDIIKSQVQSPIGLRKKLRKLAIETREKAKLALSKRSFVSPVSQTASPDFKVSENVWNVSRSSERTSYKISRSHDSVASVLKKSGSLKSDILKMIGIIEETVPVERVFLDSSVSTNADTPAITDTLRTDINSNRNDN